jgi:hypothetical protein
VLDIVKAMNGDVYISGHGAKRYLDHQLFEENGVNVKYMDYKMTPYDQLHGDFTAYVSILDLVANVGKKGKDFVNSGAIDWKESP